MVAMINKNVLPSKLSIPLVGDINVLSKLLLYNVELILFRGPFSCFENSWHLKEEFKRSSKRTELADALSKHIMWYACVNLLLAPFVFLWQLLFFFFSYAPVSERIFNKILTNLFFPTDCEERTNVSGNACVVTVWEVVFEALQ